MYGSSSICYRYGIATSADGKKYVPLAERTNDGKQAVEQIRFSARRVKSIKLVGMASTHPDKLFLVYEFEAYCIPPEVAEGKD